MVFALLRPLLDQEAVRQALAAHLHHVDQDVDRRPEFLAYRDAKFLAFFPLEHEDLPHGVVQLGMEALLLQISQCLGWHDLCGFLDNADGGHVLAAQRGIEQFVPLEDVLGEGHQQLLVVLQQGPGVVRILHRGPQQRAERALDVRRSPRGIVVVGRRPLQVEVAKHGEDHAQPVGELGAVEARQADHGVRTLRVLNVHVADGRQHDQRKHLHDLVPRGRARLGDGRQRGEAQEVHAVLRHGAEAAQASDDHHGQLGVLLVDEADLLHEAGDCIGSRLALLDRLKKLLGAGSLRNGIGRLKDDLHGAPRLLRVQKRLLHLPQEALQLRPVAVLVRLLHRDTDLPEASALPRRALAALLDDAPQCCGPVVEKVALRLLKGSDLDTELGLQERDHNAVELAEIPDALDRPQLAAIHRMHSCPPAPAEERIGLLAHLLAERGAVVAREVQVVQRAEGLQHLDHQHLVLAEISAKRVVVQL
mmetsp:Transcript_81948/g.250422  ORF Transcript_81948/g.250422 Transcript_81948/m.250422 type:complete len:477 (+) Transcript_81948:921-2351(+)